MNKNVDLKKIFESVYSEQLSAHDAHQIINQSKDDSVLGIFERRKIPLSLSKNTDEQRCETWIIYDKDCQWSSETYQTWKTQRKLRGRVSEYPFDENKISELLQNRESPANLDLVFFTRNNYKKTTENNLDHARKLFCIGQAIVKCHFPVRWIYAFEKSHSEDDAVHFAVEGFLKTITLEHPSFTWSVIGWEGLLIDTSTFWLAVDDTRSIVKSFEQNEWFHFEWFRSNAPNQKNELSTTPGGWIVTGGLGGLGRLWVNYLLSCGQQGVTICGRTEDLQVIGDLKSQWKDRIQFVQTDLSQPTDIGRLVSLTRSQWKKIKGIVHAAGLIDDSLLAQKTEQSFLRVLAPKFSIFDLYSSLKDEPLEEMWLFSSIASMGGNIGQSDYCFGNAYLDAFARQLPRLSGSLRVLSIHWPFWKNTGMAQESDKKSLYLKEMGVDAVDSQDAFQAFEFISKNFSGETAVLKGSSVNVLDEFVSKLGFAVAKIPSAQTKLVTSNAFEKELIELISNQTKVDYNEIDSTDSFDRYGIDSNDILNMTKKLEERFGPLSKSLFYQYPTIRQMSTYFVDQFPDHFVSIKEASPEELKQRELPSMERTNESMAVPESTSQHSPSQFDIAIVGISGRFPQAQTMNEFWQNLAAGKDSIVEIPQDRWNNDDYFHGEKGTENSIYAKWGGFLDDVEKFDPLFFEVSPKDAELLDPQERLFLECAWHTVEDAGYSRKRLDAETVGVFVGVMWGTYHHLGMDLWNEGQRLTPESSYASVANRVSYFFDFDGPSMAVDSMCSSSLTSLHLACQSIQTGESTMALAGGVNLTLHPYKYAQLCHGQFASTDGRCRSFGEGGDGYVPGEGVGAVLLKSLDRAIADGDTIYGVIKSTAVNSGGRVSGYTVPNPQAQAKVIRKALEKARVLPSQIGYIEAHGTGTALGDPIEIDGLKLAFGHELSDSSPKNCAIGSVKSNIGHLESAAGIAGLAKIILQMKHRTIVSSLHSTRLNPYIDLAATPFFIPQSNQEWNQEYPRTALLSGFGAGGANACVVLQEYSNPIPRRKKEENFNLVFVVSGKTKDVLVANVKTLLSELDSRSESAECMDWALTLLDGRTAFDERLAVVAQGWDELRKKWVAFVEGQNNVRGVYYANARKWRNELDGVFDSSLWLDEAISRGDFEKIAKLWSLGVEVSSEKLFKRARFVSLPGYQFQKERYWVADRKSKLKKNVAAIESIAASPKHTQDKISHIERIWEKQNLDLIETDSTPNRGCVVFLPESMSRNWVLSLWPSIDRVITVQESEQFRQISENEFQLSFSSKNDWSILWATLHGSSSRIDFVADLRPLMPMQSRSPLQEATIIFQSFLTGPLQRKLSYLNVVDESQNEYQRWSALTAFGKSVHLEISSIVWKTLRCDRFSENELAFWAQTFTKESQSWLDSEVRIQNKQRFIRSYKIASPLPAMNSSTWKIDPDKPIWIIGGLGGIGSIYALNLAQKYRVPVFVTGRSQLDDEKRLKISQWLNQGYSIQYNCLDITNYEETLSYLDRIQETHGQFQFAIHCAGSSQDSLITEKTSAQIQKVVSAKMEGADCLIRARNKHPHIGVVFISSLSSVLGNLGQSDYAYANEYLNELADQSTSGMIRSIAFSFWKDGGFKIEENALRAIEKSTGMEALSSDDGWNATLEALQSSFSTDIVFSGDSSKILALLTAPQIPKKENASLNFAFVENGKPGERWKEFLKSTFRDLLGLSEKQLSENATFTEYGIDSLTVNRFYSVLEKIVGSTPKTLLFEYRTIEDLSEYLSERYPNVFELETKKLQHVDSSNVVSGILKQEEHIHLSESPQSLDREEASDDGIAIVGISGRFPQADSVEEFWENLKSGKDCISEIPLERWNWREYFDPNPDLAHKGKIYCKWGGFLPSIDRFDPMFFQISGREAQVMDPQERLFLQTVWECMEDAGYVRNRRAYASASNRVGLFVGVTTTTHHLTGSSHWEHGNKVTPSTYPWSIANRVSYFMNWSGPSLAVDTACSSSLTAIHLAVESIKRGECISAVAGGVNIYHHPYKYIAMCQGRMLSPSGRCHAFGNQADGFVPGEGVGAIFLKSYRQAMIDGDRIYGVIRGTSVNHGGLTNGFTVPNPEAQAQVIQEALEKAHIAPETVSHIEAHGTGTSLGDPIEIRGLAKALTGNRKSNEICSISSSKSNIGHLESAAGIAGVIKVLLEMEHELLVPSIHTDTLNDSLELGESIRIQKELTPWKTKDGILRAGVSSFGAGGSNAHVLLEKISGNSTSKIPQLAIKQKELIALSAKTEDSLKKSAEALKKWILKQDASVKSDRLNHVAGLLGVEKVGIHETFEDLGADTFTLQTLKQRFGDSPDLALDVPVSHWAQSKEIVPVEITLADVCTTLRRRESMEFRLAFVATDFREAVECLDAYLSGRTERIFSSNDLKESNPSSVVLSDQARTLEQWADLWASREFDLWPQNLPVLRGRIVRLPSYRFAQINCRIEYSPKEISESSTGEEPLKINRKPEALIVKTMEKVERMESMKTNESEQKPFKITLKNVSEKATWNAAPPQEAEIRKSSIEKPEHTIPLSPSRNLPHAVSRDSKSVQSELEISSTIVKSLAKVLYVSDSDISTSKPFIEMGLDSILLVELVKLLNKELGTQLTATKLFDHPTVDQLTRWVLGQTKKSEPPTPEKEPIPLQENGAKEIPSIPSSVKISGVDYRDRLRDVLAKVLYVSSADISDTKPFIELGLDSILLVEFVKALNSQFNLNLTATQLFDHPSVEKLSQWIAQKSPALESKISSPDPVVSAISDRSEGEQRRPETLTLKKVKAEIVEDVRKQFKETTPKAMPQGPSNAQGFSLDSIVEPEDITYGPCFVSDPADDEVQIRVSASGVNLPDILCCQGYYPTMPEYPYVPGFEASGTIVAVGKNVKDFSVGDEVFGLTGWKLGAHAQKANLPARSIALKPKELSFIDAAALPIAFVTAHYALFEAGKLKKGQTVLVHSAAGGVGSMVVELARSYGATVFGTTGSREKINRLIESGVDVPICLATEDFEAVVRDKTSGRGVDVVVNMLSGEAIQKGLDCLAPGGRYVELAVAAFRAQTSLRLNRLVENQSIHVVDLRRIQGENTLRNTLDLAASLCLERTISSHAHTVVEPHNLPLTLKALSERKLTGKIVVDFSKINPQKELEEEPSVAKDSTQYEIAVVGISGQFPQAHDIHSFWENLKNAKSGVTEIPSDRWSLEDFYDPNPQTPDRSYSKWGGFLDRIDLFDPMFFDLSPRDAEYMDPQQRLFLMETWKALEDAGYSSWSINGKNCGVFVGVTGSDYTYQMDINGNALHTQAYMGSSNPILSARISYFLNLKGPNLCIDTACSSSLVALHYACRSIASGECDSALAGGVFTMTSGYFHVMASKAGMLSPTGQCHTFDRTADGFVPGEGVGVVYLKKLSDALHDGDHIYGVIKASGVNYDGKTNGITAPSSQAQSNLEHDIYDRFGIDPNTITYIETHGTGTKLGDPIEIDALKESHSLRRSRCALGSVKANIGHTLTASGIASVIKTLLCLKHRTLVSQINYNDVNPSLLLEGSPFYIPQKTQDWNDSSIPLRAAVSSFGFSGTNAHVVIEEEPEFPLMTNQEWKPFLFVFSAANRSALERKVADFARWLENWNEENIPWAQTSFTLLCGRDFFDEKVGWISSHPKDLLQKLRTSIDTWPIVRKETKGDEVALETRIESLDLSIQDWENLLLKIQSGVRIDAKKWFLPHERKRLSLPVYPFSLKRYWKPVKSGSAAIKAPAPVSASSLSLFWDSFKDKGAARRTYSKRWTGNEFFIEDHVGTVPAVVYVEWVRSCVEHWFPSQNVKAVESLVINVPLIVPQEGIEASIEIERSNVDFLEFKVTTTDSQGRSVPHAQGRVTWNAWTRKSQSIKPVELGNSDVINVPGSDLYRQLEKAGSLIGPRFRSIVQYGFDSKVLAAEIKLPESLRETKAQYRLHPTATDAGMQASVALAYANGADAEALHLPYSIERFSLLDTTSDVCRILVRSNQSLSSTSGRNSYDIEYFDSQGKLVALVEGLYLKPFFVPGKSNSPSQLENVFFYQPRWVEIAVSVTKRMFSDSVVLFGSNLKRLKSLSKYFERNEVSTHVLTPGDSTLWNSSRGTVSWDLENELTKLFPRGANSQVSRSECVLFLDDQRATAPASTARFDDDPLRTVFAFVKAVAPSRESRLLVVFPRNSEVPLPELRALSAFLRSAMIENPQFSAQIVEMDCQDESNANRIIFEEWNDDTVSDVERRRGEKLREVRKTVELERSSMIGTRLPLRSQGVYLITGGLGGLGLSLAEHWARTYKSTLILVSRRSIDAETQLRIEKMRGYGSQVFVLQADITKQFELKSKLDSLQKETGLITGIVHSAGIHKDALISNRNYDSYREILSSKIDGALNLRSILSDRDLDFWINFSSLAAVTGNAGQSCYSYANRFLHESFQSQDQSCQRILNIAWPLWKNGGMNVDEATLNYLELNGGIQALETDLGLKSLDVLLNQSATDVLVVHGRKERFEPFLGISVEQKKKVASHSTQARAPKPSRDRLESTIQQIVAEVSRYEKDEIDRATVLTKYGFDSITYTELSNAFQKRLGISMSPALFYDRTTVESLAELMERDYQPHLDHEEKGEEIISSLDATEKTQISIQRNNVVNPVDLTDFQDEVRAEIEPIAIVGMDAIFPQSKTLEELWNHLAHGDNLVVEVPKDRWDWNEYRKDLIKDQDNPFVHRGGFVSSIAEFDPAFFGVSPLEAEIMDPQLRKMFEVSWKTFENAGIVPQNCAGKNVGVYIGVCNSDYKELMPKDISKKVLMVNSMIANRLSYFYDFKGPSEPVDTACSSSLVAIHRAVEALRKNEIEMALVGAVNVMANPDTFIACINSGMLSPDGSCKTFDRSANGYVRGEGAAAVLLMPLSKAKKSGQRIHALIRSSSVNHGGHSTSPTAPNWAAQAEVIASALKPLGWTLRDLDAIELHGTGTALGDPIEWEGLKKADQILGDSSLVGKDNKTCQLGSVKSNMGHLESAAGMAGLLKLVLCIKNKEFVPTIHFNELNPHIDLQSSRFRLTTKRIPWNVGTVGHRLQTRKAGISSFGIGGVNSHVILEEYQEEERIAPAVQGPEILPFSAKTKSALRQLLEDWKLRLQQGTSTSLSVDSVLSAAARILGLDRSSLLESQSLAELGAEAWHCQSMVHFILESFPNLVLPKDVANVTFSQLVKTFPKRAFEYQLSDVAFTLRNGRQSFKHRFVAYAQRYEDLLDQINHALLTPDLKSSADTIPEVALKWLSGESVDWNSELETNGGKIVDVPTYPFSRKEFWYPKSTTTPQELNSQQISVMGYRKAWKAQGNQTYDTKSLPQNVAILFNETNAKVYEQLKKLLSNRGIILLPIRLDEINQEEIVTSGKEWARRFFQNNASIPILWIDLVDGSYRNDVVPWFKIGLFQVLVELEMAKGLEIVSAYIPDDTTPISRARVWEGFLQALGAEYKKIATRCVEFSSALNPEKLASDLLEELEINSQHVLVRRSENERSVATLEKVELKTSPQKKSDWKKGVLIAGANSAIALHALSRFAEEGVKRFVLCVRKNLPNPDLWKESILNSSDASLVRVLKCFQSLVDRGAEVRIYQGEYNDPRFSTMLSRIRKDWGELGAAIYFAGASSFENPAFVHKTQSEMFKVLQPKTESLLAFLQALEAHPNARIVAYSSIAALGPKLGAGNVDYAAANYFVDLCSNLYPRSFVSLISPLWENGGMKGTSTPTSQQLGWQPLNTQTGLRDLLVVLETDVVGPVVISERTLDVDAHMTLEKNLRIESTNPEIQKNRTEVNKQFSGRTMSALRKLIAQEFKLEESEIEDEISFGDLGIDSILMGQLLSKLEKTFGVTLEPSAFMEYPNVKALSSYIENLKPSVSEPVEDSHNIEMSDESAKKASTPLNEIPRQASQKIAIVGMACHFPGANSIEQYWKNLTQGVESIREIPSSRWNVNKHYDEKGTKGKSISKWGGFIDGIENFDPEYFKLSEELALHTDPLIRQFLEVSVDCLRDAGYSAKELWGRKVGVFAGSRMTSSYAYRFPDTVKGTVLGVGQNFIAAHLSHYYNFKGPNLVLDTACSSSLVAVDLACQSLLRGESEYALAGGVDILLDEKPFVHLSTDQVLSPSGKCFAFDERAAGLVPGEGCGMVMLKTLDRAIEDGDQIYAVIEASAVNNDGHTMGITTPNPQAQIEVIEAAYREGGIDPRTITMIEAHGTGTQIGDPIELKALTSVFSKATTDRQFCAVGSVKTNIGHLFSAAGIASLIKVVLALQNKTIPATLHCERPNPRFDFEKSPFFPNLKTIPWKITQGIRRAGISAFGFGGTNAHVVVGEWIEENRLHPVKRVRLGPENFKRRKLWLEEKEPLDDSQPVESRSGYQLILESVN